MKFWRGYIFSAIALLGLPQYASAIEIAEGCTSSQAATDKNVFNWRYYININADIPLAGIKTPAAACKHWLENGIAEGRQAHAGFHSAQYLARYADLTAAFGSTNYMAAISHYVSNGISEYRTGYQDNGINNGRQTTTIKGDADGSKIFLGVSRRNAGAVDSLIFDNLEFINAADHGRELQIASVSSWGENYNPTEAGSCNDGAGYGTSSALNAISAMGASLSTTNTPAFWHVPGVTSCGTGANSTVTALNHQFHKGINIGIPGLPNVIEFNTQINVNETVPQEPGKAPLMRFEVPTGYMTEDFKKIYRYNKSTGTLTDISSMSCLNSGCEADDPLIYATTNLSHAMGICTGYSSGAIFTTDPRYQAWGVLDPFGSPTAKWAILKYVANNVYSGSTFNFQSYLAVARSGSGGSAPQKVVATLAALHQSGRCI